MEQGYSLHLVTQALDENIPRLYGEADNGFKNVKLATLNLMKAHPEVTAIITIFDIAIAGILSAIKSLELRITKDISFVGLARGCCLI